MRSSTSDDIPGGADGHAIPSPMTTLQPIVAAGAWVASSLCPVLTGAAKNWPQAMWAVKHYWQDLASGAREAVRSTDDAAEPETIGVECDDDRLKHAAWDSNAYFRLLRHAYLASGKFAGHLLDAAGLGARERERADFVLRLLLDALSPPNFLLGNPEALHQAASTGGASLLNGVGNLIEDMVHNGARPRQTDTSAFVLGENLAATPGRVVYRNQVMELIQYDAQTEDVYSIPLLFIPQWINKYYIMDLAPGRSLIEWAVRQGHTVFAISFRNPGPELRDFGLVDYLRQGPLEALAAIEEITQSPRTNIVGPCNGGTLALLVVAWLAAGRRERVGCVTLLNTTADFADLGVLENFRDPALIDRLTRMVRDRGYLSGRHLGDLFDILRPNDRVWDHIARRWLLGEPPPVSDILAWTEDCTNMAAALCNEFMDQVCLRNQLALGELVLAGRQVDLTDVRQDVFVAAAIRDHLIPWESAYRTAGLLGGEVRFALTSGGHVTGVIRPPGSKAFHHCGSADAATPELWLAAAERREKSWWESWSDWLAERAESRRTPPPVGSDLYPAAEPAPGRYVRQR
ncbi:PHA/PHB synthase family protein [Amycolatopsis sp. NPDC058278]|uniref:PHA/PHB synthase family protein n=1 Tax=Amycolatopsis sp. NPDC058278 TaxID=3346417 RepID=UPI0036DEEB42